MLTADFWGMASAGGTATAYHLLAQACPVCCWGFTAPLKISTIPGIAQRLPVLHSGAVHEQQSVLAQTSVLS